MFKFLCLTFFLFICKLIIVHGTNVGEPQICYPLRNHNLNRPKGDKGDKGDRGDSGICNCNVYDSEFERIQAKLRYFSGRLDV